VLNILQVMLLEKVPVMQLLWMVYVMASLVTGLVMSKRRIEILWSWQIWSMVLLGHTRLAI